MRLACLLSFSNSFYQVLKVTYAQYSKNRHKKVCVGLMRTFAAYCVFWGVNLIALDLDRVCNESCILRTTEKLVILMFEKSRARLCLCIRIFNKMLEWKDKINELLFHYLFMRPRYCFSRGHGTYPFWSSGLKQNSASSLGYNYSYSNFFIWGNQVFHLLK